MNNTGKMTEIIDEMGKFDEKIPTLDKGLTEKLEQEHQKAKLHQMRSHGQ